MYDILAEYALIGAKAKIAEIERMIEEESEDVGDLYEQLVIEKDMLERIKTCQKYSYRIAIPTKARKKAFVRENGLDIPEEKIAKIKSYLYDKQNKRVAKVFFEGDDTSEYERDYAVRYSN